jgi:hypothetical protein
MGIGDIADALYLGCTRENDDLGAVLRETDRGTKRESSLTVIKSKYSKA